MAEQRDSAPFPETYKEGLEELKYWSRRVGEVDIGSPDEERTKYELDTLLRAAQYSMEKRHKKFEMTGVKPRGAEEDAFNIALRGLVNEVQAYLERIAKTPESSQK